MESEVVSVYIKVAPNTPGVSLCLIFEGVLQNIYLYIVMKNIQYMKDSRIPQLIINQRRFHTAQLARKIPHLLKDCWSRWVPQQAHPQGLTALAGTQIAPPLASEAGCYVVRWRRTNRYLR